MTAHIPEPQDMIVLRLPLADFDALHRVADKRGKTVTIDRERLAALLADHSKCLAALRGRYREGSES